MMTVYTICICNIKHYFSYVRTNEMQIAIVEVPETYVGAVVELLGKWRGQMLDVQATGYVLYHTWLSWVYTNFCKYSTYKQHEVDIYMQNLTLKPEINCEKIYVS